MPLLAFPNELLLQITSNLDGPSTYALLLTNRRLSRLLPFTHISNTCASIDHFTTAVFCAATSKSEHKLRLLLNQPPQPTSDPEDFPGCDITIHTLSAYRPHTILFHRQPREFNFPSSIPAILANAPNIAVQGRQYGKTPLHYAAESGQIDKVRMLLRRGHNIDIKDHDKDSALLCALKSNHDHIARLLIESGADIHATARNGHTTFHLTAAWGHPEIVELMLERGANIEGRDRDGHTVLHDAAQGGKEDLVRLLLRKGANINAQVIEYYAPFTSIDMGWGDTPLHLAARRRNDKVVQLLLEKGADTSIRGRDGSFAAFGKDR